MCLKLQSDFHAAQCMCETVYAAEINESINSVIRPEANWNTVMRIK